MATLTSRTLHLLILWITSVASLALKNYTTTVCTSIYNAESEDRAMRLSCPHGGLIYILQAFHGRSSSSLCAFIEGDTCLRNSLYWGPVVACLGRSVCVIPARPLTLTSCGQQSDYLQVIYQCLADDVSSRFDICGSHPSSVPSGVPLVTEGHIMTTNFPSPYPRQALCDCLITAAIPTHTRIELELLDFHLQASPDCRYDYVELLRGEEIGGRPGGTDRMCGGIGRWARKTVNSTWARLRLQTDNGGEFRGFWIKVWARTKDDTTVPVTVTCQRHVPTPTPLLPSGDANRNYVTPVPPAGFATSDGRQIWAGALPTEGSTLQAVGRNDGPPPFSKNGGIIIGVCVAGVITMVVINIVGIIICRRNMRANRLKQLEAEAAQQAANSIDSLSSIDPEYVSLNTTRAQHNNHHYQPPDENSLYSPISRGPSGRNKSFRGLPHIPDGAIVGNGSIPEPDVIVERTPGVGQSSVTPSDYDYGMLPATYTRKSHKLGDRPEGAEDEDPYAILRDHMRIPHKPADTVYASFRQQKGRSSSRRNKARVYADDYEDIDECQMNMEEYVPPRDTPNYRIGEERGSSLRASGRSTLSAAPTSAAPVHYLDPDHGFCPANRSQGSGSSGRVSCSSFEQDHEHPGQDKHQHAGHRHLPGSSEQTQHTCPPYPEDGDIPESEMSCSFDSGTHSPRAPHTDTNCQARMETFDYAPSEASTTRSEYL